MLSYRKSLIFVIAFWIGFQLMAVLGIGIDRPPYSDEQHFCETVVSFGEEITIEKLRTYDEMSTPLQFVLYSLWGRLFGFAMWQLRMLSIIIALAKLASVALAAAIPTSGNQNKSSPPAFKTNSSTSAGKLSRSKTITNGASE